MEEITKEEHCKVYRGHKKTEIIDFKRDKYDTPGEIVTIEYDPNRSSFIALIKYPDGEKRYIVAQSTKSAGSASNFRNRWG